MRDTRCFLCSTETDKVCQSCEVVNFCTSNHLSTHRPDEDCLPYKIEYMEGVGRIVVAVRDINAGEVVLTETALVSGPGSKTPPVCVECLAEWSGESLL